MEKKKEKNKMEFHNVWIPEQPRLTNKKSKIKSETVCLKSDSMLEERVMAASYTIKTVLQLCPPLKRCTLVLFLS